MSGKRFMNKLMLDGNESPRFGSLQSHASDTLGKNICGELLRQKNQFQAKLYSEDAIDLDELSQCDNLNPFKDWLVSILTDACSLVEEIDGEIINVIEEKEKKLQQMINYNQDLEGQNQVLREQLDSIQKSSVVTPRSSTYTNNSHAVTENALETILQQEEEKFFEINQREKRTSIMLKKTETDNLDLQRRLTETDERVFKYEEQLNYLQDQVKQLRTKLKKAEHEREEQAQTLMTTEESLVNTQSSQVKVEEELNEKLRQLQEELRGCIEKNEELNDACKWLQGQLEEANGQIEEKDKMINTFEKIDSKTIAKLKQSQQNEQLLKKLLESNQRNSAPNMTAVEKPVKADLGDLSKVTALLDRDKTHVQIKLGNENFKIKIANHRNASVMSNTTMGNPVQKFKVPSLDGNHQLPQFGRNSYHQSSVTPSAALFRNKTKSISYMPMQSPINIKNPPQARDSQEGSQQTSDSGQSESEMLEKQSEQPTDYSLVGLGQNQMNMYASVNKDDPMQRQSDPSVSINVDYLEINTNTPRSQLPGEHMMAQNQRMEQAMRESVSQAEQREEQAYQNVGDSFQAYEAGFEAGRLIKDVQECGYTLKLDPVSIKPNCRCLDCDT